MKTLAKRNQEWTRPRCLGHRDRENEWFCDEETCPMTSAAAVLEDRLLAIEHLSYSAREAIRHNAEGSIPITATLEAVRVLARSITDASSIGEDEDLLHDGSSRLRWTVLRMAEDEQPRLVSSAGGRR